MRELFNIILPKSQIVIGIAYRVYMWDGSFHKVVVIDRDKDSVTIEYEDDSLVNRIPIDYFRDELEAAMVSRPLPRRTDYFRGTKWEPQQENIEEENPEAVSRAILRAVAQ